MEGIYGLSWFDAAKDATEGGYMDLVQFFVEKAKSSNFEDGFEWDEIIEKASQCGHSQIREYLVNERRVLGI